MVRTRVPYDTHIQLGGKDELHADNGRDHRAAAVDVRSQNARDRRSVCSTPNMGVILWGASPLYLVPETFH